MNLRKDHYTKLACEILAGVVLVLSRN